MFLRLTKRVLFWWRSIDARNQLMLLQIEYITDYTNYT
jgi:hypothetical protein